MSAGEETPAAAAAPAQEAGEAEPTAQPTDAPAETAEEPAAKRVKQDAGAKGGSNGSKGKGGKKGAKKGGGKGAKKGKKGKQQQAPEQVVQYGDDGEYDPVAYVPAGAVVPVAAPVQPQVPQVVSLVPYNFAPVVAGAPGVPQVPLTPALSFESQRATQAASTYASYVQGVTVDAAGERQVARAFNHQGGKGKKGRGKGGAKGAKRPKPDETVVLEEAGGWAKLQRGDAIFYVHKSTRESSWEAPQAFVEGLQAAQMRAAQDELNIIAAAKMAKVAKAAEDAAARVRAAEQKEAMQRVISTQPLEDTAQLGALKRKR